LYIYRYRAFGDTPSQRAAEDIAFSVARWFSKNGSHANYYMVYIAVVQNLINLLVRNIRT